MTTPAEIERSLTDEAIALAFGWFSFGSKSTVTSRPPHENMKHNRALLDELLSLHLITHEHETSKYGHDNHIFQGTSLLDGVLESDHARDVVRSLLSSRKAQEQPK